MARGEFTFRQVGPPLLDRVIGDTHIRLIAEYDPAAQDPTSTLRFRAGRVFGEDKEYLKATSVAIFSADTADILLAVWPEILKKVAELKGGLPAKEPKVTVTKSNARDDLGDELAKRLGLGKAQPTVQTAVGAMPVAPQYAQPSQPAPAQPAPAQPGNGRKAKRPF